MTEVELLPNPSFSHGWSNLLPWQNLTNQVPFGYALEIKVPGMMLLSAGSGIIDDPPIYEEATIVPECVHKRNRDLPADEQLGGPKALVLDGDTTYKVFAGAGAFSAVLSTVVVAPFAGKLRAKVPVQVHQHGDGSPGAAVWRLIVNNTVSKWATFGFGFKDRQWVVARAEADVAAGQVINTALVMESRALAGIDFWTDAWSLTLETSNGGVILPTYRRTYNVIPQDATDARAAEIFLEGWRRSRETAGGSYDDAGIIPGSIARLYDLPQTMQERFLDWYEERYPTTVVQFAGDISGPDPDPDPEPPPGPDPDKPMLPKALSAGLHFTFTAPGKRADDAGPLDLPDVAQRYIAEGKPSIVKAVVGGEAYKVGRYARQHSPLTRTVWRRVVTDGDYLVGDLRAQAQRLLDTYKREADTAVKNFGISYDEFWDKVDYISGVNELISNWDANTDKQVALEVHFADLVDAQIGNATKATLLAVPVGNPNHDPRDILRLLPAARMSAERGHLLDYHAYWTAGEQPVSYLEQEWRWYPGRWAEWDLVFAGEGVKPYYFFGESGMIFDPTGGTWVGSGKGWKRAGDILNYIDQIAVMNRYLRDWNARNGNRCYGGALFTCDYSWGWDDYLLKGGDLLEVLKWMKTL